MAITLNVNGTDHTVAVSSDTPLLWVLRDVIGLTGTKYGCGIEYCGACTVLIGGSAERSCDTDVGEVQGRPITTIEGLSPDGSHPVQQAWIAHQVPQCGYCQPGMIMATVGGGGAAQADESDDSNLCVCGTYQRIAAAIASLK